MEQTLNTTSSFSSTKPPKTLRDTVRLLRLLMIGTSIFALVFMLAVIVLQWVSLVPSETVPAIIGITFIMFTNIGITFVFIQRNHTFFAGRFFFYSLVLIITLAIILFGGANSPLIISYFVPIVAAGFIVQSSDSLRIGTVVVLCYVGLVIAQEFFALQPLLHLGQSGVYLFLFTFVSCSAILALLSWLTSRDLTNALSESQERAEELLDRTEQIMEKNIQQVELGSELSAASAQLQLTSQQQASGAGEQASAVSQISTTIEQLGSTARQIALTTEQVAQAAQHTLENLSNGQDAVDASIQAMERIRSRVQDVATRVLSLGERSQQIGEIIDLIDDISDETHLLALNAAIEAAGAGEHGRRFAVVAAEVKSLANRTLAAAKEVKGVIAEIQQATNAAVLAAEEGGKEVEIGVDLAHRAGQVMDTVVMVAERTAQSAAEIGLATAQQQSASEQVVETMREIAEVARQTAAGAQQMADSSAMLTAIANRLHGIAQSSPA